MAPLLGCITCRGQPIATVIVWSVSLLVTPVSTTKTDELTEMPFGLWTWMGPRNRELAGSKGQFWGLFPWLKCIRLGKQQTLQQHGAADLSAKDITSQQKCSFRMDLSTTGVRSAEAMPPFDKNL